MGPSDEQMNWLDCRRPVEDAEIDGVENALGVHFAVDYRECVRKCNGGVPSRVEVCGWLDDRPSWLIPFAEDDGGDFICFDYSKANGAGTPAIGASPDA
jgi:hypothetical protein